MQVSRACTFAAAADRRFSSGGPWVITVRLVVRVSDRLRDAGWVLQLRTRVTGKLESRRSRQRSRVSGGYRRMRDLSMVDTWHAVTFSLLLAEKWVSN